MRALTEQERMAPILGSVLLMAVFCTATERMGKYGLYGRMGMGAVSIAGIFLFHGQLLDGMALYWNDMADILGSRAGIYLKRFETAGIQGEDVSRLIFLIYLGIAAAVCGFLILKLKFYLLVLAWALVLPALSGILGMEPDAGTGVIFYMGILLELNLILSRSGRKRHRAESSRAFLTGSILACAVMLAAGILLEQFMPSEDYGSSTLVTEAKKEALDGISSLRYKKGKINTLPDGKLKECGAWSASDDTALSVTMENPDSLYLRGFVGSVYDGSSWKSLDTEDAYKQRTLFYWLHQDGFYGETQLSRARALADDDTLSDKVSEVDIKNEKADSRYLYTPYEITELPVGYRKETPFADSMLKAKGLFGARNYHYQANGNLVKDFTVLGARVYQALARDEGDSYRDDESYYNAFVYSQDTKLSGALETLFRKELGDGGNREQGHTDYYTAISRIRSYLEKNLTYSTAADPYTGQGDFAEDFLTNTRIGHSVHYATAAALMFRYYGIPSRYVEGYLVTPEEIINVVMEGLKEKSPDQWKSYLNMHDIFATYSKDYEKVDHALAEQLSKCISYKILSVQEDQAEKSATATLSITSLDMKRVLKHYQDLLIHYAATSKSLRASSSELADETAALLAQALTENTDTTDTEVTIHFTNNGSSWEIQLNEDFTNALLGNAGAAIQAFQNGSVDVSDSVSDTEQ